MSNRIPSGTTAAHGPPLATPGFDRFFVNGILEGLVGVTRHRIKAPHLLARIGIVSRHITTDAEFRTTVTDDHLAIDHARCACDRVWAVFGRSLYLPDQFTRRRVNSNQTAITHTRINFAFPRGSATVDRIATHVDEPGFIHLWIVGPNLFTCFRIQCKHFAPTTRDVHHTIHNDGSCFDTTRIAQIVVPGHTKIFHVFSVDLVKRTIALLGVSATVRHPVTRLLVCGNNARFSNICRYGRDLRDWRLAG